MAVLSIKWAGPALSTGGTLEALKTQKNINRATISFASTSSLSDGELIGQFGPISYAHGS